MQTFTYKEKQYLWSLIERNFQRSFKNQTEPLEKPMEVEERKLRSRMRRKCDIYLDELVLAQFAGLLPTELMKALKFSTASEAVNKLSMLRMLELHEEYSNKTQ